MVSSKRPTRMQAALLETTRDFVEGSLTPEGDLRKLTLRVAGKGSLPVAPKLTPTDIRSVREEANVSQAVLAAYIGVSVGFLSRLERGEVNASRPVARLLDLIRRKGLDAVA